MAFKNYRKETSESSDSKNWAKRQLISCGEYFFESIEGCNQNSYNLTTMILERLRVDCDDGLPSSINEIKEEIIIAEGGKDHLRRKFNLAKKLGCKFFYVLYCLEREQVWLYSIAPNEFKLDQTFSSFNDFSNWIYTNKNWGSKKDYHKKDLPEFDRRLRKCKCGCPWPTNVDCIVFNKSNQPVAIIEYQNASKTKVRNHSNNFRFLFGQTRTNKITNEEEIDEDLRRWKSQEILRLQGNLRFFIITWDEGGLDYMIKEVLQVTFPDISFDKAGEELKRRFHLFMNTNNSDERHQLEEQLASDISSYSLMFKEDLKRMYKTKYSPPLSIDNKTFPLIYYKFKQISYGFPGNLSTDFSYFMQNHFEI